jgi:hypothetical protein
MNEKQAIALSAAGALALALAFLLLAVTGAQAKPDAALPAAQADVVSGAISYQGRLLDSGGNPVDGTPAITFSLYAQPSGGSPLWQDWFNVPVADGLFHVTLAPPTALFDGRPLWLGVRVQGDPGELDPRQQLLPAPYALSLRPGALVSASLPSAPILRLVNASSGPALSLYANAESALWATSDAPLPAIYAETSAAGPGLRGDSASGSGVFGLGLTAGVKGQSASGSGIEGVSASGSGVEGHSTSGPGVEGVSGSGSGVAGHSTSGPGGTFTSTTGAGLFASSDAGHALVTSGPSIVQGPNPQQIALLRWYPAIQTPVSFTVGNVPCAIAFDGANVWVTNAGDGTVSVLRASDGSHVMTPTVGHGPMGIAFDGANMWVTNYDDGTVSVLRASDGSPVMTPNVGSHPHAIAFDGASIWVVNGWDNTVSVLRAGDGSHAMTLTVGSNPGGIAFDGANMWVANQFGNTVSVLRASDGSHVMTLAVGTNPKGVAFDGTNMWVTNGGDDTLSVLRASDGSLVMTLDVGNMPWAIAFDGANMWVTNYADNTVSKR